MLPRRGLCRSAIAIPPCLPDSTAWADSGQQRYGSTVTRDRIHESGSGLWGAMQSPLCLVPHAVSGLATNIPYLNESGCFGTPVRGGLLVFGMELF